MRYRFMLVFTITFIAGCRANYEISPELDESRLASVTIYRTNIRFDSNGARKPYFYIDGMQVGRLGTGMAISTKVTPGKHVISVRDAVMSPVFLPKQIEKDFEAGKIYYIRFSKEFSGFDTAKPGLVPRISIFLSFGDEESYSARH